MLDTSGASCNRFAAAPTTPAPDLAVELLAGAVAYDSATSELRVTYSIVNVTATAAGPFSIAFYAYPDASDPCRGYRVGQGATTGLPAGLRLSGTATIKLTADTRPPGGPYQIGYVADVDNAIGESDETNNVRVLGSVIEL
jgi:subtilase family serine protease